MLICRVVTLMDGFTGKRIKAMTPEERKDQPLFWTCGDYYTFDDPAEFGYKVKLNMAKTEKLAKLINGTTRNAEIEMISAHRVDAGIEIAVKVKPTDPNLEKFIAKWTVNPDFALSEMASETKDNIDTEIASRKAKQNDFPDKRTGIGQ